MRLLRAVVLRCLHRFDEAEKLLNQFPDRALSGYYHLALMFRLKGDYAASFSALDADARLLPSWPNALQRILTLKASGDEAAAQSLTASLPPYAFVYWEGKMVHPSRVNFQDILQHYLNIEHNLPEISSASLSAPFAFDAYVRWSTLLLIYSLV